MTRRSLVPTSGKQQRHTPRQPATGKLILDFFMSQTEENVNEKEPFVAIYFFKLYIKKKIRKKKLKPKYILQTDTKQEKCQINYMIHGALQTTQAFCMQPTLSPLSQEKMTSLLNSPFPLVSVRFLVPRRIL